jgi:L-aminopeptidase/D-esterase-like protein
VSRRRFVASLGAGAAGAALPTRGDGAEEDREMPAGGLTDVAGIRVGQRTHPGRPTGCTVILAEAGAVCGVDVRGGAPGTRETDLLDPLNTVERAHAVVLSGGSAFGLDAASGVVRYLEERGVGFPVGPVKVPIVPAAILFDLLVGGDPQQRPDAEMGYAAAEAAQAGAIEEGSVGAGAGATVGKLFGPERSMRGGLGTASLRLPDGLVVAALVAVNAVGDVVDPDSGRIVAGTRTPDGGGLQGAVEPLLRGEVPASLLAGGNTTIGAIATNAALSQVGAARVARMAHDGIALSVRPAHTPWDGDTLFTLATGTFEGATDLVVGVLAQIVVARAIVRGSLAASSLPSIPASRDLRA